MDNWKQVATFWVDGVPIPQPRPRAKGGGRKGVYNPDAKGLPEWKQAITVAICRNMDTPKLTGPVMVDIDFYRKRPKDLYRKKDPEGPILHTVTPDRDNLDKVVLDVMTKSGIWGDDGQACDGRIRKFYHAKNGRPGATITISQPVESAQLNLLETA